jgi:hypothetical protein
VTSSGVHPGDMFEHDPDLAAFARDLRAAAASGAPPTVGPVLAAVLEGREAPPAPASLPDPSPRRRRTGLRWAIGGAVFGLGLGSLGVAGALPDPVQRQVANLGDVVGVHLPEPASDSPATSVVPQVSPPSTVPPARSSHPTTSVAGDHRGGADDRGSSDDHPSPGPSEDRGRGDEHRSDSGAANADDGNKGGQSDEHRNPRSTSTVPRDDRGSGHDDQQG